MKSLITIFAICWAIAVSFTAKANHLLGSHIGYKAIDSITYEVTLTLYWSCNGSSPLPVKIGVTGKSSGYFETIPTKVSTADITGAYLNCNISSRCSNGNYPYGFEKVIFKDTVNISGGTCQYRFSFKECCRKISSIHGINVGHYNYAVVNKCFGMNNSVQADLNPFLLIPVNRVVSMNTLLGDNIDKVDSVSYEMVDPLQDSLSTKVYKAPMSLQRPITFLGFPNSNLPNPAGFRFYEHTGIVSFRPTRVNEIAVFCTEVKEYRKINGKMEVVGITRLDHDVIVISAPNNNWSPRIKGSSATICANKKSCITFEASDNDTTDSTNLTVVGLPQGATVTYGRNGRFATAEVCFTPANSQARNTPYNFAVYASDNSCSIEGRNAWIVSFTVKPSPDSSNFKIVSKTPQCNTAEVKLYADNTISNFLVVDEDSVSALTTNPASVVFRGTGWKKFFATAANQYSCSYTIDDSVRLKPPYVLNLNTQKDTFFCSPSTITLTRIPTNGAAPYRHIWQEQDTTHKDTVTSLTKSFNTLGDSKFCVEVRDKNNCIAYDSVAITLFPPLTIDAGNDTTVCNNSPVELKANIIAGTAPFSYLWRNNSSTTDTTTVTPNITTPYIAVVRDSNGCKTFDSLLVTVNQNPLAKAPKDKTLCQGAQIKVIGTAFGGRSPYNYLWSNNISTDSFSTVISNPVSYELQVTDTNGCIGFDTVSYDTFPTQKAILTPLANPFCDDAPPVGLKSIPNTGIWTGAGVNGKIFNPVTAGAGVHPLTFNFKSIYNCPEQDEIVAVVKRTPQPDFTVDKTKGVPNTPFSFTNQTIADTTYTSEWNMGDGSPLLTTQNVTHSFSNIGTYTITLKVDNGVCPVKTITKSNVIEIDSIINFIPNAQNHILSIFPIPANTVLNTVTSNDVTSIVIADLQGKQMLKEQGFGKENSINVQHIPQGIYIITIELKSGAKQMNKILITH